MGVDRQPDPMKLTEEQRDKLDKWNQNKQMITHLSDVADMTQDMLSLLSDGNKEDKQAVKKFGALMVDMRDSLVALKDKEAPETPDTAKPVVDAMFKLEKALTDAIKAIDVKPNVSVGAPQVNVDSPVVDVDLSGVEKALKTDLPKAFKDFLKLIPKPEKFDPKPLLKVWEGISKQLESIETATRMKPQFPVSQLNEINSKLAQTLVAGSNYNYLDVQQTDSDTETYVFKTGGSGGTIVRTITVNYTSSAKTDIDNVTWS